MADRTVRISQLAWQRFKQAALDQGITLKAYLESLAADPVEAGAQVPREDA